MANLQVGVAGNGTVTVGAGASVHSPASNTLTLGTNNSERLRIDSSGKLITNGNVTPYDTRSATFQPPASQTNSYVSIIAGSTSAVSGLTFGDAAGQAAGNYAGMFEYYHNGDHLTYKQNNTEWLRIKSTGEIGIGTIPGSGVTVDVDDSGGGVIAVRRSSTSTANKITLSHDGTNGTLDSTNAILFRGGGAERARIDSSGRLLLGHTADIGFGFRHQLVGTDGNTSSQSQSRFSANASGPSFVFSKSRNGTPGSNTIVNDGDTLGLIQFRGDDGGDYLTTGAQIEAKVDGTPGANDLPTRLTFATTADGANSATERLRITSAGAWGIGGANYGTDGQVLTSGGSGAAVAWEDAGGGLFSRAWYDMDTTETTITGSSGETRVGGNSGANLEVTWTPPSTSTKYVYVCYLHFRYSDGGQWGWQPEFTSNNWTSKTGIGNHPSYGNEYPDHVIRHGLVQVGDFHPNTTSECKLGLFATVWSSHSASITLNGSLQKSRIFLYEVADPQSNFSGI